MAAGSILYLDGIILTVFCSLFGNNGEGFKYYIHEKVKVKLAQFSGLENSRESRRVRHN